MSTLVLDIETAPLPSDKLVVPEFKAPANLKDPAKIAAAVEEKRKEWEATLALHAETARVLVVGVWHSECETPAFYEGDEVGILKNVWTILREGQTVIGHNLKGFDIVMLARRSWILGVPVPPIMEGKWLSRRFVDTMELWSMGTQERISLDNLARALGVGKKSGSGKDFAATYEKDREAALAYLSNDLALTKLVAERMGLA